MSAGCFSLLYQSDKTLLSTFDAKLNILKLMVSLLQKTIESLVIFSKGNLSNFDPHVGDTLCQVRAYQLFLLTKKRQFVDYIDEINLLNSVYKITCQKVVEFETFLNNSNQEHKKALAKPQSLDIFFDGENLVFDLSSDALLIMQSYFLTHFKDIDSSDNTCINYERICRDMSVSRKLAKKLVHYYQNNLAKKSTEFVQKLAGYLSYNDKKLSIFCEHFKCIDDDGRNVLPCYLGMKILLLHKLKTNCPILVVINRYLADGGQIDTIPLLYIPKNGDFELKTDSIYSNEVCVVIQGSVNYQSPSTLENVNQFVDRFRGVSLVEIVLANMAYHPQYSGSKLKSYSFDPYEVFLNNQLGMKVNNELIGLWEMRAIENQRTEFLKMKDFSKTIGCCEVNPSLFFIKHIFCDTINHQLIILSSIPTHMNEKCAKLSYIKQDIELFN